MIRTTHYTPTTQHQIKLFFVFRDLFSHYTFVLSNLLVFVRDKHYLKMSSTYIFFDMLNFLEEYRLCSSIHQFLYNAPYSNHSTSNKTLVCLFYSKVKFPFVLRSEEHTSELQSLRHLVC